MTLTHIYMYDNNSENGNLIKDRLGLLRINHGENSNFKARPGRIVLNWGSSELPLQVRRCTVINPEQSVYTAVNKLRCLRELNVNGIPVPEFTEDQADALEWLDEGGVYARTKLTGHDGDGCVYMSPNANTFIRNAKMYTKALPIEHEFRVTMLCSPRRDHHLGCQWKVSDGSRDHPDMNIRTTQGGWGFRPVQREENLNALYELTHDTLATLGLNFGGVDIVRSDGEYYVLEVNTAPVMTPYVMDNFINALREDYIEEQID